MSNETMYKFRNFYIPSRMMSGINMWVTHGIRPGSFLNAVLENNLRSACECADDENIVNLPAYIAYFYNDAPSQCWGSKEKVDAWEKMMADRREAAAT